MVLPRVEGTEASLGAEMWLLQPLLPEEDIVTYTIWLLLQICAAIHTRLGGDGGSGSVRRAQIVHSQVPS